MVVVVRVVLMLVLFMLLLWLLLLLLLLLLSRKVDKIRFAKLKAKDALSFLDKKLKKSLETFKPVGEKVKSFVPTKSVNKLKR